MNTFGCIVLVLCILGALAAPFRKDAIRTSDKIVLMVRELTISGYILLTLIK